MTIPTQAFDLIVRLSEANLQEVKNPCENGGIEALHRAYKLAGIPFPSKIILYDSPDCECFEDAIDFHGSSKVSEVVRMNLDMIKRRYHEEPDVNAAWDMWASHPSRSARCAFIYGDASAVDYDFDRLIMLAAYFYGGITRGITTQEWDALEILKALVEAREAGVGWFTDGDDTLYIAAAPQVMTDDEGEFHCEACIGCDEVHHGVEFLDGTVWCYKHGTPVGIDEVDEYLLASYEEFMNSLDLEAD